MLKDKKDLNRALQGQFPIGLVAYLQVARVKKVGVCVLWLLLQLIRLFSGARLACNLVYYGRI